MPDEKIRDQTEAAIIGTDILLYTKDPGGTPLDRKIAAENLVGYLALNQGDIYQAGPTLNQLQRFGIGLAFQRERVNAGATSREWTYETDLQKNTETLVGTKTLTDASEAIQFLDPDGVNRDVNLPAEAGTNPVFYIVNTAGAAFNLVIKDDSPAIIRTI